MKETVATTDEKNRRRLLVGRAEWALSECETGRFGWGGLVAVVERRGCNDREYVGVNDSHIGLPAASQTHTVFHSVEVTDRELVLRTVRGAVVVGCAVLMLYISSHPHPSLFRNLSNSQKPLSYLFD